MPKKTFKVSNGVNQNSKPIDIYKHHDGVNAAYESTGSISSKQSKKSKQKENVKSIGLRKLFSYTTIGDSVMIFFAIIMSIFTGISFPLVIFVFGNTTDNMANYQYYLLGLINKLKALNVAVPPDPSISTLVNMMKTIDPQFQLDPKYDVFGIMQTMSQYFAYIALGVLISSYLSVTFFVITSQNQISRIRNALFTSILRQNIGWFDSQNSGAINNKLIDDLNTVHAGIGDKIGQMVHWFSCCIGGVILAFISGWKLTLVTLSVSPFIVITMVALSKTMMKLNQKVSEAYGRAGGIAEEVLGAIRTVMSFRGEKFEVNRYISNLDDACKMGLKKNLLTGTLLGLVTGLMYGSYSLGFWYGSKLVREGELVVGKMLIIFFSCLMSTMGLGQATPHMSALNEARNSAAGIFEIIDRIPEIDKMDKSGKKIENFKGEISFKNVRFHYPTRSDCPILKDMSLNVQPGQTAALVGPSGCGKSSLIQLIQRFYDATEGEVFIDDINIKELNVKWLREQIGVVSQEPILFDYTIKENIRFGRMDVTDEEINQALIMSNAKTFIDTLPDGLNTLVGERGTQLSGGQKQRIAIARALVRNPKILLLDEATSALDTESEKIVQDALDKVCLGRTTLIVAHRLSTVRNANIIFGIKDGRVLEKGNHKELMELNGLYKELVERQKIDLKEDDELKTDIKKIDLIQKKSLVRKKSSILEEVIKITEENKKNANYFFRIMKLNAPEKWYILLGCIGGIFNGASQPAFSVIFGYIIPTVANPDLKKQEQDIQIYVIILVCLAVVIFLANVTQSGGFGQSGECLTKRCRSLTFEAMLNQDIAWFDDPDNNIGALTTRLSDGASAIRGLSGESLGSFFQAVATLGVAVVISLVYCWQIALTVLLFVPVIFIGGILQVKIMQGFSNSDKGALEKSGKIAVECIENIRTVSNLTREETFIEHYREAVLTLTEDINKKAHAQGILYGISQSAVFCAYAATFILAGYLLQNNQTSMTSVYIAFGSLIFGAMNLGKSMAMAPGYAKGKLAAAQMFELLGRKPAISSHYSTGVILDAPTTKGFIQVDKVKFSYPLRPNVIVMNDVSFNIEPNKTIALVGPSGCGKSTIIQLLQRFYDALEGKINIDDTKIPDININSLRQLFSIVSQEPTLFSYSIKENIAYADMDKLYSDEQIIEAAKSSNIHDFISSLPDKYDTKVGEKGSNFSGGQKQRIAIARALLRNPKILLLDEATSALDTESEKIVQNALDKAQVGRTCLVIAHRLSTIQNADKIIVFKEGKIQETGTHIELLSKNGIYSQMIKLQSQK